MWASRDNENGVSNKILFWDHKPVFTAFGTWAGSGETGFGWLTVQFCKSIGFDVGLGECVEIEDIVLKRKAKPIKVKHNFEFSEPGAKLEGDGIKGKRRAKR